MKKMKTVLILVLLSVSTILACKKDKKTSDTIYNYDVALSGTNEVPANASTATGRFVGSYTKSTKVLSFTLSYSGLAPTDWHIHKGDPTTSGPVEIGLNPVVPSPLTKSVTLTSAQETDLLSGNYYVNIHSLDFPGGEIRAQLASPGIIETDDTVGY
jgi:hypothetical protein